MSESDPQPGVLDSGALLSRVIQARLDRRFAEAAAGARELLARHPWDPEAVMQLGHALAAQPQCIPEAITMLEESLIRINGRVPGRGSLLAGLYRLENRLDEALAMARQAKLEEPDDLNCVINEGLIERDLGHDDAAMGCFMTALARNPDYANAHLGVAEILLARGEFGPGWLEYEARLPPEREERGGEDRWPVMAAPKWNGMRLPRGRILLLADQGYGDVLQFSRYIPLVAERCREVAMCCDAALAPLLTGMRGLALFSNDWQHMPPHTAWIRVSSLPSIFGTDLANIPPVEPLHPQAARVDEWRKRLDASLPPEPLRVGLVWAGRPTHGNDRRRSIGFAPLRPLLELPGISFVALQKPIAAQDQAAVTAQPNLWQWSEDLVDFGETAALLANLDLVITIDSAVAHLAGAIGKPAWILLPKPGEWRWLSGDRSPWYPQARLFRQTTPGDWGEVVAQVREQLSRITKGRADEH